MNITFRKCILKKVTVNTQISEKKKSNNKKNKFKTSSRLRNINGCGVC